MKKIFLSLFVVFALTVSYTYAQGPGPAVLNINPVKKISKVNQPRQIEFLDRGLIAMRQGGDSVYVGWRMLGTEPQNISFTQYNAGEICCAKKLADDDKYLVRDL